MGIKHVYKRLFASVLICSFTALLTAQNCLSPSANMIETGDSITKELVKYVYAGMAGKNVIWDYSDIEVEDTCYIKYDTINHEIIGYDMYKTYRYQRNRDELLLGGYESPLSKMDYKSPILSLPLNLEYGQSVSSGYSGEGKYCGTHFEHSFGNVSITADGLGTLILSENDTLYNTLRVYTVNTESIRLNIDSCRNDSDNLKQVITERYQWFARGYRYPVFETVTSSTYHNLNHVATQQYAYRCPPNIQLQLNDSVNEQIRISDQLLTHNKDFNVEHDTGQITGECGFSYSISSNGNLTTITYDLELPATVHAMLVDVMGTVYRDIQQTHEAGMAYTLDIDCSGLRHGQYIIYINVNGTIFNTKIPL